MEGYLYAALKTDAIAAVQDMQASVSDPADPRMYEEEVPAKRPNLSLPTQLRSEAKTQPMYAILFSPLSLCCLQIDFASVSPLTMCKDDLVCHQASGHEEQQ